MRKALMIGGGVLAGAALLGVGVAVGSNVGQEEVVVAASDAEGPLNQQDQLLIGEFTNVTRSFDQLIVKVQKGKISVGEQITKNAVASLNIGRLAANESLKEAATVTGEAMMLIGAGVTANDEQTTREGVEAYQVAQETIVDLAQEINPEAIQEQSGDSSDAPESGDPDNTGETTSGDGDAADDSTQE